MTETWHGHDRPLHCTPLSTVYRIDNLLNATKELVLEANQFQDGQCVVTTLGIEQLERAIRIVDPRFNISEESSTDWCEHCNTFREL